MIRYYNKNKSEAYAIGKVASDFVKNFYVWDLPIKKYIEKIEAIIC